MSDATIDLEGGYAANDVGSIIRFLEGYADSAANNVNSAASSIETMIGADIDLRDAPDIEGTLSEVRGVLSSIGEPDPNTTTAIDWPTDTVGDSPAINDYTMPNSPDVDTPSMGALQTINIPTFDSQAITDFNSWVKSSLPNISSYPDDLDINNITMTVPQNYSHQTVFLSARDKLNTNIVDGGTMLNGTVETDLFNREKERDEQVLQDSIDKITNQWSKLGWDLPDGMLANMMLGVYNEYNNKRLTTSKDISIKQAELEHDGLFKSLEMAIGHEKVYLDNLNNYAIRLFEQQKQTGIFLIEIFKENSRKFNDSINLFKEDVSAYGQYILAKKTEVESYLVELEAQKVIQSVNESTVNVYKAEIEATKLQWDNFKTQVEAVVAQYDAEKTKLMAYKTSADIYISRIDAEAKRFLAEEEAYKARTQAWGTGVQAKVAASEAIIRSSMAVNEQLIKEWEIQARMKELELQSKLEACKTLAQTFSNQIAGALSGIHAGAQYSGGYTSNYGIQHTFNY
jgi:hypothetical protein